MNPERSNSPQTLSRQRPRRWLHGVVGCLRGLTWLVRMVVMLEFAIRMMVSLTLGQYGNAVWEITVVIALCPAWDETANEKLSDSRQE